MTAQLRHQFRRYARRRQNLQPFFDEQLSNIGTHQGSERILGRNAAEAVALLRTYIDALPPWRDRTYYFDFPSALSDLHHHYSKPQSVYTLAAALYSRSFPFGTHL